MRKLKVFSLFFALFSLFFLFGLFFSPAFIPRAEAKVSLSSFKSKLSSIFSPVSLRATPASAVDSAGDFTPDPAPYLSGWNKRKVVTVTNSSQALTNYQVLLTVNTQELIAAGTLQSACQDIRAADDNGTSAIPYWIESGCNTASTRIWVNTTIPANSAKKLFLYYNNPNAQPESNANISRVMDQGLRVGYWQDPSLASVSFQTLKTAFTETNPFPNCLSRDPISYDWSVNVAVSGCSNDKANKTDLIGIRFEGWLMPKNNLTGRYSFTVPVDDWMRISLGGTTRETQEMGRYGFGHDLTSLQSFRLDYLEDHGQAKIGLNWTPPGGSEEVVPATQFFSRQRVNPEPAVAIRNDSRPVILKVNDRDDDRVNFERWGAYMTLKWEIDNDVVDPTTCALKYVPEPNPGNVPWTVVPGFSHTYPSINYQLNYSQNLRLECRGKAGTAAANQTYNDSVILKLDPYVLLEASTNVSANPPDNSFFHQGSGSGITKANHGDNIWFRYRGEGIAPNTCSLHSLSIGSSSSSISGQLPDDKTFSMPLLSEIGMFPRKSQATADPMILSRDFELRCQKADGGGTVTSRVPINLNPFVRLSGLLVDSTAATNYFPNSTNPLVYPMDDIDRKKLDLTWIGEGIKAGSCKLETDSQSYNLSPKPKQENANIATGRYQWGDDRLSLTDFPRTFKLTCTTADNRSITAIVPGEGKDKIETWPDPFVELQVNGNARAVVEKGSNYQLKWLTSPSIASCVIEGTPLNYNIDPVSFNATVVTQADGWWNTLSPSPQADLSKDFVLTCLDSSAKISQSTASVGILRNFLFKVNGLNFDSDGKIVTSLLSNVEVRLTNSGNTLLGKTNQRGEFRLKLGEGEGFCFLHPGYYSICDTFKPYLRPNESPFMATVTLTTKDYSPNRVWGQLRNGDNLYGGVKVGLFAGFNLKQVGGVTVSHYKPQAITMTLGKGGFEGGYVFTVNDIMDDTVVATYVIKTDQASCGKAVRACYVLTHASVPFAFAGSAGTSLRADIDGYSPIPVVSRYKFTYSARLYTGLGGIKNVDNQVKLTGFKDSLGRPIQPTDSNGNPLTGELSGSVYFPTDSDYYRTNYPGAIDENFNIVNLRITASFSYQPSAGGRPVASSDTVATFMLGSFRNTNSGEPDTALAQVSVFFHPQKDCSLANGINNFYFCGDLAKTLATNAGWQQTWKKIDSTRQSIMTASRVGQDYIPPIYIDSDILENNAYFFYEAEATNGCTKPVNYYVLLTLDYLNNAKRRESIDHTLAHELGHFKDYYNGGLCRNTSESAQFLLALRGIESNSKFNQRFFGLIDEDFYHPDHLPLFHGSENYNETYAASFHVLSLHNSTYNNWFNQVRGSTVDGRALSTGSLSNSEFNTFKNLVNTLNGYITGTEPLT